MTYELHGQGRTCARTPPAIAARTQPTTDLPFSLCDAGLTGNPDLVVDTIVFNDGSKYSGTLKNGVPDGLGTCTWKDGNKYDGEWRAGLMHGFGTYIWTSGQRYDGEWKVIVLPAAACHVR